VAQDNAYVELNEFQFPVRAELGDRGTRTGPVASNTSDFFKGRWGIQGPVRRFHYTATLCPQRQDFPRPAICSVGRSDRLDSRSHVARRWRNQRMSLTEPHQRLSGRTDPQPTSTHASMRDGYVTASVAGSRSTRPHRIRPRARSRGRGVQPWPPGVCGDLSGWAAAQYS
jgi:hypothetical protein